jgi:hypothetical protein
MSIVARQRSFGLFASILLWSSVALAQSSAPTPSSNPEWIKLPKDVQLAGNSQGGGTAILVDWKNKILGEIASTDVMVAQDGGPTQVKVGAKIQFHLIKGQAVPQNPAVKGVENRKAGCVWFVLACCGSGRMIKAGPDLANGCGNGTERYEPTCDHPY